MRSICLIATLLFLSFQSLQAKKDSLAIYHLNNLEAVFEDVEKLAGMFEIPLPTEQYMMQFGQLLLMSPTMEGINRTGRFTIYLGIKEKGSLEFLPPISVLFPVLDGGKKYLEILKKSFPDNSVSEDGVHSFNILPAVLPQKKYFYVKLMNDKYALASYNLGKMKAMADDLSKEELQIIKNLSGRFSISINTETINETISKQMGTIKETVNLETEMEEESDTQPFQGDMGKVMDHYENSILQVIKQIDFLIINLNVHEQLTLQTYIKPTSETLLHKITDGMKPVSPVVKSLTSQEGSWLTTWAALGEVDDFVEVYGKWAANLYSVLGPPWDSMAPVIQNLMGGLKGFYSGDFAFLMLPATTNNMMRMKGVYGVKDMNQAKVKFNKLVEDFNESMAQIDENELTLIHEKSECSEYNGVGIEHYKFSMELPPEMSGVETVNDIYKNMDYDIAYVTNFMLFSVGGESLIKECIDHFQSGEKTAPIISEFDDVKEPFLGHLRFDLIQMLNTYGELLEKGVQGFDAEEIKNLRGGLSGVAFKKDDGYSMMLRFSKEDLETFKKIVTLFLPKLVSCHTCNEGMIAADFLLSKAGNRRAYRKDTYPVFQRRSAKNLSNPSGAREFCRSAALSQNDDAFASPYLFRLAETTKFFSSYLHYRCDMTLAASNE